MSDNDKFTLTLILQSEETGAKVNVELGECKRARLMEEPTTANLLTLLEHFAPPEPTA